MSARRYTIQSGATVVVPIDVRTIGDPTGAVPSFSATTTTATDPGAFTDGTWSGAWSSTTRLVTALTPTLPGSLSLAEGDFKLWLKYVVGSETVILPVGILGVG